MARCRLLAVDLDGTLMRDDGTIAACDLEALERARGLGVAVTLVTGRLPVWTLPWARALALDAPLICADGAITVWARSGEVRSLTSLARPALRSLCGLADRTGLPASFLTDERVLGVREEEGTLLSGWSPRFEALARASDVLAHTRPVVSAFLTGTADEIDRAAALHAQLPSRAHSDVFPLAGRHTLRLRPLDVDKGTALERLARSLGLEREEVAAVGDWYNDMPMLRWAGASFAMGQAPDSVAQSARSKLKATAAEGGAIAEVMSVLFGAGE